MVLVFQAIIFAKAEISKTRCVARYAKLIISQKVMRGINVYSIHGECSSIIHILIAEFISIE